MKPVFHNSIIFLSAILFVLLFVGVTTPEENPFEKEVWNAGHFFLFAGISFLINTHPSAQKRPFFILFLFTLLFSLTLGLITESLQLLVGRNFEFLDIWHDILGGFFGFFIIQIFKTSITAERVRRALLALCILLLGINSLLFAIYNKLQQTIQFPVISSFESDNELTNWHTTATNISLTSSPTKEGSFALSATFLASQYPTIALHNFQNNWQGYTSFSFHIYNPQSRELSLTLKIDDKQHSQSGYLYADRFNQVITLPSGWSFHKVSLVNIINAPQNRQLDITRLSSVSFFLVEPSQTTLLFFDELRLNKN